MLCFPLFNTSCAYLTQLVTDFALTVAIVLTGHVTGLACLSVLLSVCSLQVSNLIIRTCGKTKTGVNVSRPGVTGVLIFN